MEAMEEEMAVAGAGGALFGAPAAKCAGNCGQKVGAWSALVGCGRRGVLLVACFFFLPLSQSDGIAWQVGNCWCDASCAKTGDCCPGFVYKEQCKVRGERSSPRNNDNLQSSTIINDHQRSSTINNNQQQ